MNHLWWCCASSIGNEELIREKWLSILNHIRGINSWEDNKLFHKCEHGQLDKKRKWLITDSPSFLALKNVVENKKILVDVKYLSKFVTREIWKYFTQYSTNIVQKGFTLRCRARQRGHSWQCQIIIVAQITFKSQQKMENEDTNTFFLK